MAYRFDYNRFFDTASLREQDFQSFDFELSVSTDTSVQSPVETMIGTIMIPKKSQVMCLQDLLIQYLVIVRQHLQ